MSNQPSSNPRRVSRSKKRKKWEIRPATWSVDTEMRPPRAIISSPEALCYQSICVQFGDESLVRDVDFFCGENEIIVLNIPDPSVSMSCHNGNHITSILIWDEQGVQGSVDFSYTFNNPGSESLCLNSSKPVKLVAVTKLELESLALSDTERFALEQFLRSVMSGCFGFQSEIHGEFSQLIRDPSAENALSFINAVFEVVSSRPQLYALAISRTWNDLSFEDLTACIVSKTPNSPNDGGEESAVLSELRDLEFI